MTEAFVKVPVRLSKDKRLRNHPLAERVYVLILRYAREKRNRPSWAGYDSVAKEIGCSTRTVARTVAALVETGWFKVEKRDGRTHFYWPGDGTTPDTGVRGAGGDGRTTPDAGVHGTHDTHVRRPVTPVSHDVDGGAEEDLSRDIQIRFESGVQRAALRTLREEVFGGVE